MITLVAGRREQKWALRSGKKGDAPLPRLRGPRPRPGGPGTLHGWQVVR